MELNSPIAFGEVNTDKSNLSGGPGGTRTLDQLRVREVS